MAKQILQFTKNYEMFVFEDDNRDISNAHVKELAASMTRNGFIKSKAISVKKMNGSSKLKVKDGQHRLLAAQMAGVSVWYNIDEEISDEMLPDLQIAKKWLPKDYLKHFVHKNIKEYVTVQSLEAMFPKVSIMTMVSMLHGGTSESGYHEEFYRGTIKVTHLQLTTRTLELASELETQYKHRWLHNRTFLVAFMNALQLEGFDYKRFVEKLKYQSEKFVQMMSVEGYFKMFEGIYNYKSTEQYRIPFVYDPNRKPAGRPKRTEE